MRICRGSISIVFGLLVPQPVAVAIATIVLAAVSTRTPMIVQSSASKIIQPAEQASLDIVRSPVIEPIPVFFVGTGDGGNGSYDEPPTL